MDLQKWLDGYKTYITAGAILAAGIMASYKVEIPEYVWGALAALGLAFLRVAVEKSKVKR